MQQEQGEDSSLLRAAEVEGRLTVSDLERPKNAEVEHRRRTYHGIRVDGSSALRCQQAVRALAAA